MAPLLQLARRKTSDLEVIMQAQIYTIPWGKGSLTVTKPMVIFITTRITTLMITLMTTLVINLMTTLVTTLMIISMITLMIISAARPTHTAISYPKPQENRSQKQSTSLGL